MAFATLGILAAAIITAVWQGVWIRRQWYTMEGQLVAANNALALTRQSNELSQRAWLVPIIADEYDPPAAVVTVRTKNSGRSPAFEVLTTYDGGNLPSEPQSATELRYRHFAGLVAADDVIAFKVKMSLEVRQGQRSYIYGKVTYRDAFTREPEAKPRETEFCRYYDPEIRRFGFCKGLNTAR